LASFILFSQDVSGCNWIRGLGYVAGTRPGGIYDVGCDPKPEDCIRQFCGSDKVEAYIGGPTGFVITGKMQSGIVPEPPADHEEGLVIEGGGGIYTLAIGPEE
jgi:hypothetical protein